MGFNVSINNGTVTTRSADDGVNASFDDGLADQNATPSITINGGTVKVYADADGLDSNGDLIITGGTVVGIGSGGMPQTPTAGQGWVQQNVTVKAQDRVKVTDSNDAEVVAGENAQGGFGSGPGGVGGPGSGGSNDLGVMPPENGDLRAPVLTGSSRRGETNQPTDGSSS